MGRRRCTVGHRLRAEKLRLEGPSRAATVIECEWQEGYGAAIDSIGNLAVSRSFLFACPENDLSAVTGRNPPSVLDKVF